MAGALLSSVLHDDREWPASLGPAGSCGAAVALNCATTRGIMILVLCNFFLPTRRKSHFFPGSYSGRQKLAEGIQFQKQDNLSGRPRHALEVYGGLPPDQPTNKTFNKYFKFKHTFLVRKTFIDRCLNVQCATVSCNSTEYTVVGQCSFFLSESWKNAGGISWCLCRSSATGSTPVSELPSLHYNVYANIFYQL